MKGKSSTTSVTSKTSKTSVVASECLATTTTKFASRGLYTDELRIEAIRAEASQLLQILMQEQEKEIEELDQAIAHRQDLVNVRMESKNGYGRYLGMRALLELEVQREHAHVLYAQLKAVAMEIFARVENADATMEDYEIKISEILSTPVPNCDLQGTDEEIIEHARLRLQNFALYA